MKFHIPVIRGINHEKPVVPIGLFLAKHLLGLGLAATRTLLQWKQRGVSSLPI
jgi:hypothetical protein